MRFSCFAANGVNTRGYTRCNTPNYPISISYYRSLPSPGWTPGIFCLPRNDAGVFPHLNIFVVLARTLTLLDRVGNGMILQTHFHMIHIVSNCRLFANPLPRQRIDLLDLTFSIVRFIV